LALPEMRLLFRDRGFDFYRLVEWYHGNGRHFASAARRLGVEQLASHAHHHEPNNVGRQSALSALARRVMNPAKTYVAAR
jgi:hypothetical protein